MNKDLNSELTTKELEQLDELHASVWPSAVAGSLDHIELILAIMDRRAAITGLYNPAEIDGGFSGNARYLAGRIDDLPP